MMTTDSTVRREVIMEIKRRVRPGTPITKKIWKEAYDEVRKAAIYETCLWKYKYIDINLL